jgi:nitronate monooxygenase
MTPGDSLRRQTVLPVIAAPMFLVSGVDLVVAACRAGVIGAFPALNGRTAADFRAMLEAIGAQLQASRDADPGASIAPYGVNLIVHHTNPRVAEDLALCAEYRVPLVITSLGKPTAIVETVHGYGGLVLSDVATIEHARKAAECGVDGLILVCAGAGGHAGRLNPFAFVAGVREFYEGIVVVAGCISDGRAVRACEALGADLAYLGTRFIATQESLAPQAYKTMIVGSAAADIVYTPAVSGVPASFLRASLEQSGYDLANLDQVQRPLNMNMEEEAKAWRDTWSAGQGVHTIHDIPSVAELVRRLRTEYEAAPAGRGLGVPPIDIS